MKMGMVRYLRDAPPAHCKLKIESFSNLQKSGFREYNSSEFEASGYKWILVLHPNGNLFGDAQGYISLYLRVRDDDGPIEAECYRRNKYEWGFDELIYEEEFKDPCKGYLVDDACEFGVEVFVDKCSSSSNQLSRSLTPTNNVYVWPISNFSGITGKNFYSPTFTIGGYEWRLSLRPDGYKDDYGVYHVCLLLGIADPKSLKEDLPTPIDVKFKMFVLDNINERFVTVPVDGEVERPSEGFNKDKLWGFLDLIPQDDFNDPSKGYLVNDACQFGVEVYLEFPPIPPRDSLSATTTFSSQWSIPNYSRIISKKRHYSPEFTFLGIKWKLHISEERFSSENYLRVGIIIVEPLHLHGRKVYAELEMTVKNQVTAKNEVRKDKCQFSFSSYRWWSFKFIIPLTTLNNVSNGFLVNDTLTVAARIEVISVT